MWVLQSNGSWSYNDAQANSQPASYAISQGYTAPTAQQIVSAGLATPTSQYAAYNPDVKAITVQPTVQTVTAWNPPTEAVTIQAETKPAQDASATSKTTTQQTQQQQTPAENLPADTSGDEVLSTDHPLDWQSIYDQLPAPVQSAIDKAQEIAPWYVWAAGAAAALYVASNGRKHRR